MEEVINLKAIRTKTVGSNGWSMLASALLRDAVRYGDIDFLESDWGESIYELANINHNISMEKLKEIAYDIYDKRVSEYMGDDIFSL